MSRGITKIEIIIVIFLVVIIIAADIFAAQYLGKKSRDINILSDISQMRSSLEAYLMINNHYPVAGEVVSLNDSYLGTEKLCVEGFKRLGDICTKTLLKPVPNAYLKEGNIYSYKSTDSDLNYQIQFTLNTNFVKFGLTKGVNCATNTTITSAPCF